MEITWYGYSCFRIIERGQTSVLTDPYHPTLDLAELRIKADLITISHDRASHQAEQIRDVKYIIAGPGEYELGELFVTAIPLHRHDAERDAVLENVACHFEYPHGLNWLHLGKLNQLPDQSIIEQLDDVQALMLPVGGDGLSGDHLADLISMIEPKYVLPMQPIGVSDADFALAADAFFKGMGLANLEPQDALRVTASSLPEQTQVVQLRSALVTS